MFQNFTDKYFKKERQDFTEDKCFRHASFCTLLRKQCRNFTEEKCFDPARIGNITVLRKEEYSLLASSKTFSLQLLFRNYSSSCLHVRRFIPFDHWPLKKHQKLQPFCPPLENLKFLSTQHKKPELSAESHF